MLSVESRHYVPFVVLALAATGCAARPAEPSSPTSDAAPAPTERSSQAGLGAPESAEEAGLRDETKKKAESDDARASTAPTPAAQAPAPRAVESTKEGEPAAAPRDASSALAQFDQAEASLLRTLAAAGGISAAGGRCADVCKAIDSMRRAADGVCRLDAGRCPDAKARLARAEDRAKASCSACGTSP